MVLFILAQHHALCNKLIVALSATNVGWVSFLNPTTTLNSLGFTIGPTQPTPWDIPLQRSILPKNSIYEIACFSSGR